jgi:hypothetical protein
VAQKYAHNRQDQPASCLLAAAAAARAVKPCSVLLIVALRGRHSDPDLERQPAGTVTAGRFSAILQPAFHDRAAG